MIHVVLRQALRRAHERGEREVELDVRNAILAGDEALVTRAPEGWPRLHGNIVSVQGEVTRVSVRCGKLMEYLNAVAEGL